MLTTIEHQPPWRVTCAVSLESSWTWLTRKLPRRAMRQLEDDDDD